MSAEAGTACPEEEESIVPDVSHQSKGSKTGITCSHCGRTFAWRAELAGKRVKCKCGNPLTVPVQPDVRPASPSGAATTTTATANRAATATPPIAPQTPAPAADVMEGPAAARRGGSGRIAAIVCIVIGVILAIHYAHRALFVAAGPDRGTSMPAWLFPLDGMYAGARAVLSIVAILVGMVALRDWARGRRMLRAYAWSSLGAGVLFLAALGASATGNVNDRQMQDVLVFCASPFLLNIASDVLSLRAAPDGAR